jgi:hypothetical protein
MLIFNLGNRNVMVRIELVEFLKLLMAESFPVKYLATSVLVCLGESADEENLSTVPLVSL